MLRLQKSADPHAREAAGRPSATHAPATALAPSARSRVNHRNSRAITAVTTSKPFGPSALAGAIGTRDRARRPTNPVARPETLYPDGPVRARDRAISPPRGPLHRAPAPASVLNPLRVPPPTPFRRVPAWPRPSGFRGKAVRSVSGLPAAPPLRGPRACACAASGRRMPRCGSLCLYVCPAVAQRALLQRIDELRLRMLGAA